MIIYNYIVNIGGQMNLLVKTLLYVSTMIMALFFVVAALETSLFPTWFVLLTYAFWTLSFVSTFSTNKE